MILIAEDNKGIIGTAQIVFRLPQGFNDPEAANGTDIAMLEMLRTRQGASPQVAERLIQEIENIALKRNFKALTFCISTEQPRAIAQVKAWGFQEFRLMPEKRGMLAFFRKILQPGFDPSPPKPQPPEPKKPPPPPPPEPQGPDEV